MSPEPFELDRSDPVYAGQAVYTPRMLRVYDLVVTRFSNSLIWRCPARRILEHYDRHVRASHLDVGPGTGYYLDRCSFPSAEPRITFRQILPVARFAGRPARTRGERGADRAGAVLPDIASTPHMAAAIWAVGNFPIH